MTTATNEQEYFHCPEFAITMPVAECKSRRNSKLDVDFKTASKDKAGFTRAVMTRKCLSCTVFNEHTAPSKRLSHEDMMARLQDRPSQEASKLRYSGHVNSSLVPFQYRRDL